MPKPKPTKKEKARTRAKRSAPKSTVLGVEPPLETGSAAPVAVEPEESEVLTATAPVQGPITDQQIFILGDDSLVGEWVRSLEARSVPFTLKHRSSPPPRTTTVVLELTNLDLARKRENLIALDAVLSPAALILSSSVTVSATEQASWIYSPARLVGIGALPTLSSRPLIEVAPTIHTPASAIDAAAKFFRGLGKEIEIVQDRVGLVFARTLCRLINEAAFALAEEVATPQDLDAAIRLGLNHPHGPIEWVDRLGLAHVAAILAALERESGDPRYRTAPLLRQMALAGEWWKR